MSFELRDFCRELMEPLNDLNLEYGTCWISSDCPSFLVIVTISFFLCRIVLLIFVSGKVVLTGAKVRQEIYEAFDNIHPILKNFKKQ